MSGTAGSYTRPVLTGQTVVPGTTSVLASASGAWVDVAGSDLALPEAGTYRVQADVRGAISGLVPFNVHIAARLFNVTAAVAVADTERFVVQMATADPGGHIQSDNDTVPIAATITVAGPTTIRLQAARTDEPGSSPASAAGIFSSAPTGLTVLRYTRLG